MNNQIYKKYSDVINLPSLIQVKDNLIIASFILMKLLPAKYIIEKAIQEKVLHKGKTLVETSSGTYALGLGIVCSEHQIPFHIVSDPVIDLDLKQQLLFLGGSVEIVEDHINGHQVARLKALKQYLNNHKTSFWPQQYDNEDHLKAYSRFAEYLLNQIGSDFILVATVGSGSSSSGTMLHLRKSNPKISLVGVDTFGSILFGLKNEKRLLRGLGNSIMPKNLNHHLFDQVHWVSARQAFKSTIELYSNLGLYVGATTGSAYLVAKWVAEQNPKRKVVFISPDLGHRYTSTVYNDNWMKQLGKIDKIENPISFRKINLIDNNLDWACLNWHRRSLQEVISG